MEDQQNTQIQQQEQQNRHGWREMRFDTEGLLTPAEIRMHEIIRAHGHAKYSQNCMHRKKRVLSDLRSLFQKKAEDDKDRSGGIRKLISRKRIIITPEMCQRTALEMMQKPDQISDLVIAIQSPHFKITEKGNLNKTNGLLSADKTDALTNGPLVREVEKGSILCDSHQVSGSVNHTVPIMDASEQTLSMG